MANFTTTEKGLIFELFGIPRGGKSTVISGIALRPPGLDNFSATWKEGDHSSVVSLLNTKISEVEALTDNGTINRIKVHLAEYSEICQSVLKMESSREGAGRIADDEKKVEKLRRLVSDNLGFAVPRGGFSWDADVAYGNEWHGGGWQRY